MPLRLTTDWNIEDDNKHLRDSASADDIRERNFPSKFTILHHWSRNILYQGSIANEKESTESILSLLVTTWKAIASSNLKLHQLLVACLGGIGSASSRIYIQNIRRTCKYMRQHELLK